MVHPDPHGTRAERVAYYDHLDQLDRLNNALNQADQTHHPHIYKGRGAWTQCACGWQSPRYNTVMQASKAWADHLATT